MSHKFKVGDKVHHINDTLLSDEGKVLNTSSFTNSSGSLVLVYSIRWNSSIISTHLEKELVISEVKVTLDTYPGDLSKYDSSYIKSVSK
jgi:hypothetical protein